MPKTTNKNESSTFESLLPTAIPAILILAAPLGVAGQNMGLALSIVLFAVFCLRDRCVQLKSAMTPEIIAPHAILWLMVTLPILMATVARGDYKEATRFICGYLPLALVLPIGLTLGKTNINRQTLTSLATFALAVVGLVSLSQFFIGWKLEDGEITTQIRRAQGFYSHPLTLAYAALLIVPMTASRLLAKPSDWRSVVMALSTLCIVITSQSVTVIAVTGVVTALICLRLLSRRRFLIVALAASVICGTALTIENPISEKFRTVLQGQRGDHETPYPDDRLAFWHAHWEMIKDAPLLGHGTGMTRELRKPYYERIGLSHIKRMYEAHNMFLQLAVEGGIFAAIGFIVFLYWWFVHARQAKLLEPWERLAYMITPLAFAAGGLTQNALQDSEVRYLLFAVCALSFAVMAHQKSMPGGRG